MPKRSDTEWQTLDARLARELLNCVKWDELTDEEQDAVKRWRVWRHYDGYWWQRGEGTPRLMCGILLWQPNVKVAQALEALDMIRAKGHDTSIDQKVGGPRCWVTIWAKNAPRHIVETHDLLPKAICLAIEKWMDAQKELQDDPG